MTVGSPAHATFPGGNSLAAELGTSLPIQLKVDDFGRVVAPPWSITKIIGAPSATPTRGLMVTARIAVPAPGTMVAAFGSIWVRSQDATDLIRRIDPTTNEVVGSLHIGSPGDARMAVGMGSIWVLDGRGEPVTARAGRPAVSARPVISNESAGRIAAVSSSAAPGPFPWLPRSPGSADFRCLSTVCSSRASTSAASAVFGLAMRLTPQCRRRFATPASPVRVRNSVSIRRRPRGTRE
jgi:hypothetical protein